MGQCQQPVGHQIYIPDLNAIIVAVNAQFDESIPERSQEYFDEIDNLQIDTSETAESVNDYQYLVGLRHLDGHLRYVTTRVIERRGVIVAYIGN